MLTATPPFALDPIADRRFSTNVGAGNTLLEYSLDTVPMPVQASASATSLATATLQLVVDCPRTVGSASVRQITVVIPVDPKDADPDPENLAATKPPLSGASITSSGADEWVPADGGTGIFNFTPKNAEPIDVSAQSLTITISGIPVNTVVGTASVRVNEWAAPSGSTPPKTTDPASGSRSFAVPKFPAGFTLGTFQAVPANIDPGADPTCSTTLSWNGSAGATYTIQYDDVTISHPADQPDQPLPSSGSYKVSNLQDDLTAFTLLVQAGGGTVTVQQQALVNVNHAKIENFVAFPTQVGRNGTCNVSWQTNADTCYLGVNQVAAPNGGQAVTVADSIDLTLTAMRGKDMNQQTRHVEVVAPVIGSFVASVNGAPVTDPVDAGTVVTLSWATQYAETTSIDQGVGPVGPNSDPTKPQTVTVNNSTTFMLTCTGKGNPVTSSVHVAVKPVQITTFTVTPSTVDPGGSCTLAWSTVRATSASVDNGVGAVSPVAGGSTAVSINPQSDVAFTLSCGGPDGPVTAQATLRVNSVRITGFGWSNHGNKDQYTINCSVDWSTELATLVLLSVDSDGVLDGFAANAPHPVGPNGSLPFTISEFESSITFTLSATGPGRSPVSASFYTPDES